MPDMFEGLTKNVQPIVAAQSVIVYEGKTYNSVDELPPEARRKYEEAMDKLGDANQNGIPDLLEGKGVLNVQSKQVLLSDSRLLAIGLVIAFLLALIAGLLVLVILR